MNNVSNLLVFFFYLFIFNWGKHPFVSAEFQSWASEGGLSRPECKEDYDYANAVSLFGERIE